MRACLAGKAGATEQGFKPRASTPERGILSATKVSADPSSDESAEGGVDGSDAPFGGGKISEL